MKLSMASLLSNLVPPVSLQTSDQLVHLRRHTYRNGSAVRPRATRGLNATSSHLGPERDHRTSEPTALYLVDKFPLKSDA